MISGVAADRAFGRPGSRATGVMDATHSALGPSYRREQPADPKPAARSAPGGSTVNHSDRSRGFGLGVVRADGRPGPPGLGPCGPEDAGPGSPTHGRRSLLRSMGRASVPANGAPDFARTGETARPTAGSLADIRGAAAGRIRRDRGPRRTPPAGRRRYRAVATAPAGLADPAPGARSGRLARTGRGVPNDLRPRRVCTGHALQRPLRPRSAGRPPISARKRSSRRVGPTSHPNPWQGRPDSWPTEQADHMGERGNGIECPVFFSVCSVCSVC
jgi:hypothetical protein